MKHNLILYLFIFINVFTLPFARAQTCNENATKTTPDSNFTINDNGTVRDNTTGLVWMRCSVGQSWNASTSSCSGNSTSFIWFDAFSLANSFTFADKSNWRLPNIKELSSIVELSCIDPAINETLFPQTVSSNYWTSSPFANYDVFVWVVNFSNGYSSNDYKSNSSYYRQYIRLVRNGQ